MFLSDYIILYYDAINPPLLALSPASQGVFSVQIGAPKGGEDTFNRTDSQKKHIFLIMSGSLLGYPFQDVGAKRRGIFY